MLCFSNIAASNKCIAKLAVSINFSKQFFRIRDNDFIRFFKGRLLNKKIQTFQTNYHAIDYSVGHLYKKSFVKIILNFQIQSKKQLYLLWMNANRNSKAEDGIVAQLACLIYLQNCLNQVELLKRSFFFEVIH